MAKGKSPKRKAATRAKRAGEAQRGPEVGASVHYVGKVWEIANLEKDPHNFGAFVDLERKDSEGKYEARIHSGQLAPDTTGGFTFRENIEWVPQSRAASAHAGDPRFPLTAEFVDRHQKFNQAVEAEAIKRFKKGKLGKNKSWNTIEEADKVEWRGRAREALRQELAP